MTIFLSATLIQDFLICPQRVYYRINQPEEAIKNDDMLIGSIVHEVIEKYWKDKQKALDELHSQLNFFPLSNSKKDKAVKCVDNFFLHFRDLLTDDDEIEYQFKLPIDKNVLLVGKIDRITSSGNIFDWKTSTTLPSTINNDVQFIIYSEAYRRIFKKEPVATYFASLNQGGLISLSVNKLLVDHLFNVIIPSIAVAIKYNDFYRKGIFAGGCFNCPYKKTCLEETYGIFSRESD